MMEARNNIERIHEPRNGCRLPQEPEKREESSFSNQRIQKKKKKKKSLPDILTSALSD